MSGEPPDPGKWKKLLSETDRLRALARHLALDEHSSEDVVQEGFLKALLTPPSRYSSLRSWLRVVVRNAAYDLRLRERRRRKREKLAAKYEVIRCPSDSVELQEILDQVARGEVPEMRQMNVRVDNRSGNISDTSSRS